jgi:D-alanyl-D-alanine carboxypeptidase
MLLRLLRLDHSGMERLPGPTIPGNPMKKQTLLPQSAIALSVCTRTGRLRTHKDRNTLRYLPAALLAAFALAGCQDILPGGLGSGPHAKAFTPTLPAEVAATVPVPPTVQPAPIPKELLRVISRTDGLPESYVPSGLLLLPGTILSIGGIHSVVAPVLPSLTAMMQAMALAGLRPVVSSAYRSYAEQVATFAYWTKVLGQAEADRVSAKPGHSEHQLGSAIDFASLENNYTLEEPFADTPEGKWLASNAVQYGFVMSFPAGKEQVTGYAYEPWHFRYIGPKHAAEQQQRGVTLLEYLRSLREEGNG